MIGLLKEAYEKAGLQLPMAPYGVIATDYECGIIEVRGPNVRAPTWDTSAARIDGDIC